MDTTPAGEQPGDESWRIRRTAADLDRLAETESVFALGNGWVGRRGTLDEGAPPSRSAAAPPAGRRVDYQVEPLAGPVDVRLCADLLATGAAPVTRTDAARTRPGPRTVLPTRPPPRPAVKGGAPC